MIVLDTDVISEILNLVPDQVFAARMSQVDMSDAYVTAISLGEMRAGVELLPAGHKRDLLDVQINILFERDFAGRVLDFNSGAAFEFGEIAGKLGQAVFEELLMDAEIAAIARSRGASVATRNIKHFRLFDVPLFNPWEA
jgi:hypothetical protein